MLTDVQTDYKNPFSVEHNLVHYKKRKLKQHIHLITNKQMEMRILSRIFLYENIFVTTLKPNYKTCFMLTYRQQIEHTLSFAMGHNLV